jgi:hypothetical protein
MRSSAPIPPHQGMSGEVCAIRHQETCAARGLREHIPIKPHRDISRMPPSGVIKADCCQSCGDIAMKTQMRLFGDTQALVDAPISRSRSP